MKNIQKNIYFHIGYPKSASSTLQVNLFYGHSEIELMSKVSMHIDGGSANSPELMRFFLELTASENSDELSLQFRELFEAKIQESKKHCLVFSDEDCLAGNIRYKKIADRLKSFGIDFKIIIVVRNQIDILRSMYDMNPYHYDTRNSTKKTVSFNEWTTRRLENPNDYFVEALNFKKVIEYYASLFGEENIQVLKFEDLISNKTQFVTRLSDVLKIDSKESLQLLQEKSQNDFTSHAVLKWKNKYLYWLRVGHIVPSKLRMMVFSFLGKAVKIEKTKVSEEAKNKIINRFSESNRLLSQKLNLELEKYNYPF